jgi:diguanylate cyclase (GGDEF)-like protein
VATIETIFSGTLNPLQDVNPSVTSLEELKDYVLEAKHVLSLLQDNLLLAQVNTDCEVISVSPLLQSLLNTNHGHILGQKMDDLTPPIVKNHGKLSKKALREGLTYQFESHIVTDKKDSRQEIWLDTLIMPLFDKHQNPKGALVIYKDLTAQRIIERLSVIDELTGAYNRRHFNRVFQDEINLAKKNQNFLCFLMLDVDNFKKYNDTYGHPAGDEVLKVVSTTLQDVFQRSNDFVFRLGGEEFAVLYTAKSLEAALEYAEKARQEQLSKAIEHTGNLPYHYVTFSAGLIVLEPSMEYVTEEVYKYVDEALYRAKRAGRNRIELVNNHDDGELF